MENGKIIPSAPPDEQKTSYPSIEGLVNAKWDGIINYGNHKETVKEKKTRDCIKCKNLVDKSQDHFIHWSCGHIIHFKCANLSKIANEIGCDVCSVSNKTENVNNVIDEDIGIPIDYFTNPISKEKTDKKLKLNKILDEIERLKGFKLSKAKIAQILGPSAVTRLHYPSSLTFTMLKENNITIDKLIKNDITAPTLYHEIGVTDVSQLIELGFKKKHFESSYYKLPYMLILYQLSYPQLNEHFGVTITDALNYSKGNPHYLLLIGLNMRYLLMHGLEFDVFLQNCEKFSMSEWVDTIGLNRDNFLTLTDGIPRVDFKWLNWPVLEAIKKLGLTQDDRKKLSIEIEFKKKDTNIKIDNDKKKVNKKETTKKKKSSFFMDLLEDSD